MQHVEQQTVTHLPIEHGDPADDPRAFRRALGQFATGVTVITTGTAETRVGMTANSFSAVSLDPPLVLWSIRKESGSLPAFLDSGHFSINILADHQITLSATFGRPSDDQFSRVKWVPGRFGDPLFDEAIAHLECVTHQVVDAGDHFIMIGRVENYARYEGAPLLFSQGQFGLANPFPDAPTATTAATPGDVPTQVEIDARDPENPLFMTLLKTADQKMSQLFQVHRQQVGVTVATGRVLNHLSHQPATVTELCRTASLGENAVEDALIELAGQHLVHVQPDGQWAITGQGREVQTALRRGAAEFTAAQLQGIPAEDLATAQRVLRILIDREGGRA